MGAKHRPKKTRRHMGVQFRQVIGQGESRSGRSFRLRNGNRAGLADLCLDQSAPSPVTLENVPGRRIGGKIQGEQMIAPKGVVARLGFERPLKPVGGGIRITKGEQRIAQIVMGNAGFRIEGRRPLGVGAGLFGGAEGEIGGRQIGVNVRR